MSASSESKTDGGLPLALAILAREHDAVREALDGAVRDPRAAGGAAEAVRRALDLEAEVLTPALVRSGWEGDDEDAGALRAAADALGASAAELPERIDALRGEFESYARRRERDVFPWATAHLGDDLAALAVEMEEARERLSGAYGVG